MSIKTVKLNSGFEMPVLGLGTWLSKPGEVGDAILTAFDIGYRHFDCALIYQNEPEIGDAFNKIFSSGKGKREDVFITSKIWNTFHSYEKASEAVDISLKNLQLSYLDMMLIHWPMGYLETNGLFPKLYPNEDKMIFSDVDYLDTWKAMEDAVKAGKIRSIGLSNFNRQQMELVIKNCRIKPSNLQAEANPYLTETESVKWSHDNGIVFTAYSPFANNDHPFRIEGLPNMLLDPDLVAIGRAHNKSAAQVALRWALQRNTVVIPKSTSEHRLKENFDIWNFQLTDQEMSKIDNLNQQLRICTMPMDIDHPYYPF